MTKAKGKYLYRYYFVNAMALLCMLMYSRMSTIFISCHHESSHVH
jgi:hypothetical protein